MAKAKKEIVIQDQGQIAFSVLQSTLKDALDLLHSFVDPRPHLPILANMLFEASGSRLAITATTKNFTMVRVWVGAKVYQDCSVTLPAATIKDIVALLSPERVDFHHDRQTHTMYLHCGTTDLAVKGIDSDEYPPMPSIDLDRAKSFTVEAKELLEGIDKTSFSAATEQNRPILNGVCFDMRGDGIVLAAADGYRLAVKRINAVTGQLANSQLSIAIDDLKILRKLADRYPDGEWKFDVQGFKILLETDQFLFACPVLEGRFPDYMAIVPTSALVTVKFSRDYIMKAIRRANIFARDSANSMRFTVATGDSPDESRVYVIGKSAERGEVETMIDDLIVTGDALEEIALSLNSQYVLEGLDKFSKDREYVTFGSNGAENPLVIYGDDEDVYVVMPMSR